MGSGKNFENSFRNVAWGYREIFGDILRKLRDEGLPGGSGEELEDVIGRATFETDGKDFDHVIYRFLLALNRDTYWIFRIPGLFRDVVETGFSVASINLDLGKAYFLALGRGELGDEPVYVERFTGYIRKMAGLDERLVGALIRGYGRLRRRLSPEEIDRYVDEVTRLYLRSKDKAVSMLAVENEMAFRRMEEISTQVLLEETEDSLRRLFRILRGSEPEIASVKMLLADHPERERYSGRLLFLSGRKIYLPGRMNIFGEKKRNSSLYKLLIVVAAASAELKAFPAYHGVEGGFPEAGELVGSDIYRLNLFVIADLYRLLKFMLKHYPGTGELTGSLLLREGGKAMSGIFYRLFFKGELQPVERHLSRLTEGNPHAPVLAERISGISESEVAALSDLLGDDLYSRIITPPAFLPLYTFRFNPGKAEEKADLQIKFPPRHSGSSVSVSHRGKTKRLQAEIDGESEEAGGVPVTYYYYDEWNVNLSRYEKDYCRVAEIRPAEEDCKIEDEIPKGLSERIRETARIFEHLKPLLPSREKLLEDGELIDHDRLIDFITRRRVEASPRVDFYQRNLLNKRDLAVLFLLDVSSSTEEEVEIPRGRRTVLDIEKEALLTLAAGIDRLGDAFSVCGFSGRGRLGCEFFVFKDFSESWGERVMARLLSARPRSATRIGAALRHAGFILENMDSRQKLIILITDGKPRDSLYDYSNGYAQYDVRVANMENGGKGIKTVGITTDENSVSDMEVMFPRRRFVILPGIGILPDILAKLYVKMTF